MNKQYSLPKDETAPDFEDSLGGIEEDYSLMDHAIGRSEFLQFLRTLHLDYEDKLSTSQSLAEQIRKENALLNRRLHLEASQEEKRQLEEYLKNNNQMLHYLLELQNLFENNEKFFEWMLMELRYESEALQVYEAEQNTIEEEARKARVYPYPSPTPLHFTPFRTNPYT